MSVKITTQDGSQASISIVTGTSKKTGKTWTALSVKVGEWSTLVFPKSNFELKYLIQTLGEAE